MGRKYVDLTATSEDMSGSGKRSDSETPMIHHVPFKIEYEGQANVDVKFTSKSVSSASDPSVLINQYRGRPLQGKNLDLPSGYEGVVVTDLKRSEMDSDDTGDKADSEVSVTKRFDAITYWNWDRVPSGMDKHVKLLDWMELSQVLHEPVEVDE